MASVVPPSDLQPGSLRTTPLAALLLGCTWLAGCGPGPGPAGPDPFSPPPWNEATPGSRARTRTGAPPDPQALRLHRRDSRTIPGAVACLIRLRQAGVPFKARKQLKNVITPVQITGPVGGVRYRSMGRRPLICDCRLALALLRAAPYLRALGVAELQFSSAYRRSRVAGTRRLSRHAYGLALDVHRLVTDGDPGQVLTVKADFERGLGGHCSGDSPRLNRVACLLKRGGLFDRVLTPDTDAAHYNHFHLAILSLHRRRFVPKSTPPAASTE